MTASEAKQCIDLNEQYEQTLSLSVSQNNNGKMKNIKFIIRPLRNMTLNS